MNRPPLRRVAPPVALLVASALSGCSQLTHTDDAAVVNGEKVTVSEVQEATRELAAQPGLDGVNSSTVAQMLAYSKIALPLAEKEGVAVSAAEVAQRVPTLKDPSKPTLDTLRTVMVLQGPGAQNQKFANTFTKDLQAASIDINPRYGTLNRTDPQKAPLADPVLPWIKATSLADKDAAGQQ